VGVPVGDPIAGMDGLVVGKTIGDNAGPLGMELTGHSKGIYLSVVLTKLSPNRRDAILNLRLELTVCSTYSKLVYPKNCSFPSSHKYRDACKSFKSKRVPVCKSTSRSPSTIDRASTDKFQSSGSNANRLIACNVKSEPIRTLVSSSASIFTGSL